MAIQVSGNISLQDIQTEFGGSDPISMDEYYRGGAYVPNIGANQNIPLSGTIALDNFYGATSDPGGFMFITDENSTVQRAATIGLDKSLYLVSYDTLSSVLLSRYDSTGTKIFSKKLQLTIPSITSSYVTIAIDSTSNYAYTTLRSNTTSNAYVTTIVSDSSGTILADKTLDLGASNVFYVIGAPLTPTTTIRDALYGCVPTKYYTTVKGSGFSYYKFNTNTFNYDWLISSPTADTFTWKGSPLRVYNGNVLILGTTGTMSAILKANTNTGSVVSVSKNNIAGFVVDYLVDTTSTYEAITVADSSFKAPTYSSYTLHNNILQYAISSSTNKYAIASIAANKVTVGYVGGTPANTMPTIVQYASFTSNSIVYSSHYHLTKPGYSSPLYLPVASSYTFNNNDDYNIRYTYISTNNSATPASITARIPLATPLANGTYGYLEAVSATIAPTTVSTNTNMYFTNAASPSVVSFSTNPVNYSTTVTNASNTFVVTLTNL